MYDICLNKMFKFLPEMSDLQQEIPIVVDVVFQKRLFPPSSPPGVLGLDLPKNLAKRLLERFILFGSDGYYFPSAYHQPRISLERANEIAAEAIDKLRREHELDDHLGSLFQSYTYPCFWSFGVISEQMTKEKRIPNAIFVCIDKLDGHVWQEEELRCLSRGSLLGNED